MNLLRAASVLVVVAASLFFGGCSSNCTANLQCTNYGCTNMIYYVDSDGHTRVAYTMGFGSQAIISNCQSITSVVVVDPNCCFGMIARRYGTSQTVYANPRVSFIAKSA